MEGSFEEIGGMKGPVLPAAGSEREVMAKIVDTIKSKLHLKLVSTLAILTGMDTRAKGNNSRLKNEQPGDDIVAICGMGGSGKTTLAQYIYSMNNQNFESSSFLQDIGHRSKIPHGLLELQNQLLGDILWSRHVRITNVAEGTSKIQEALQKKRVLIVLDDIDERDQLDALLGTKPFHTRSKIIITTRFLEIHAWFGSISWRCQVREPELLNDQESLELISLHAFGSKTIPMEGLEELAVQLAKYCAGHPLALEVLSCSLSASTESPRERNGIIEDWRNALNLLQGGLYIPKSLQDVLQRSYDSLQNQDHKKLFLDIAFFFVGEYEDDVMKILERDRDTKSGIKTLINRCLLTVSPSGKLMMHQLLQEMGRKIVHEESKHCAKRSRVLHDDESYRVLAKGIGSKTIEGLALDMQKLNRTMRSEPLAIKTDSFAKMDKLKLLQLKYVELTGSFKNFPKLRWLCWHGCHLKTIQPGLLMSSLVAIDMSYGNLETFEPPMVLDSLKILNLKGCRNLVSICNLDRLPNLEDLILWNCGSLTHVCNTIGGLESLALLDLSGCHNLSSNMGIVNQLKRFFGRGIPQGLLFSLPHSLRFLLLNNCKLPYNNDDDVPVLSNGKQVLYMNLGNNLFEFLPNYIDLKSLRVLDLTSCPNLKSLLCLPSTLEELYTYRCGSLEKITFQSARFTLRVFGYEGCVKLSEVQGLLKLVPVEKVDKKDLRHMNWIKEYQHLKVDLVGDVVTKNRDFAVQMLYEYGIISTYLPGYIQEKDQRRGMFVNMLPSSFVSLGVPLCRRILGLYVSCVYRLSGKDEDMLVLFAKISNTTRGLTWIYNPVVVCKPKVGEDVTWVSYWPIGNMLATGDVVKLSIIVGNGLMVSECGAALGCLDIEVEKENEENNTKGEEVIGGDLSGFELSRRGWYYLCRRDFISSTTPDWLNTLFGDTTECTELQGWRTSQQSQHLMAPFMELKTFRHPPESTNIK